MVSQKAASGQLSTSYVPIYITIYLRIGVKPGRIYNDLRMHISDLESDGVKLT